MERNNEFFEKDARISMMGGDFLIVDRYQNGDQILLKLKHFPSEHMEIIPLSMLLRRLQSSR